MIRLRNICAGVLLCAVAAGANADSLTSQIAYHNDIIHHTFVVEEASNLVAWTDSYGDGINFDPIVAVWRDGVQLAQVDDDASIAAGQTIYDSGLRLYNLTPGTYLFTIAAYDNFANGTTLDAGFMLDGAVPVALADWCQPASSCNMGPDVSLHWALNPVPEPSAWALLSVGGALIGAAALRRRRVAGGANLAAGGAGS